MAALAEAIAGETWVSEANQRRIEAFPGKWSAISAESQPVQGFAVRRADDAGELAKRTRTQERLVREWLSGQAAAGCVDYDEADDKFYLEAEQSLCSPMKVVRQTLTALAGPHTRRFG